MNIDHVIEWMTRTGTKKIENVGKENKPGQTEHTSFRITETFGVEYTFLVGDEKLKDLENNK